MVGMEEMEEEEGRIRRLVPNVTHAPSKGVMD